MYIAYDNVLYNGSLCDKRDSTRPRYRSGRDILEKLFLSVTGAGTIALPSEAASRFDDWSDGLNLSSCPWECMGSTVVTDKSSVIQPCTVRAVNSKETCVYTTRLTHS